MENIINKSVAKENDYVAFEYNIIGTKNAYADLYVDNMPCFGWQIVEKNNGIDGVSLKFKRNRDIANRQELDALQRKFELTVDNVKEYDKSKTTAANLSALAVAIVGTGFMAGSVFCITAATPLIAPCIILGILGAVGWILPYFLYSLIKRRKTNRVMPKIEQSYDKIYQICRDAKGIQAV